MRKELYVPLNKLHISHTNVRMKEDPDRIRLLAENIMQRGLINRLVVRPEDKGYGVICGRLRFKAINLIKREYPKIYEKLFPEGVPVVVVEVDDREAMLLSLSENLQQKTMDEDEIGAAIEKLRSYGLDVEDIVREVQVQLGELKKALKAWREAKKALEASIAAEKKSAGRPPTSKPPSTKFSIGKTHLSRLLALGRKLKEEGIVRDEKEVIEELRNEISGLSTREVELVTSTVEKNPEIWVKGEVKKLVSTIREDVYVQRQVVLKKWISDTIRDIANRKGVFFDIVLNELLEKALEDVS